MSAAAFETDAVVIRRNRALLALAGVPLLVAAVVAILPHRRPMAGGLAIAGVFTLLHVWSANPLRTRTEGPLRADAGGVWLGGKLLLARADIREGFLVPRAGDTPVVRLHARGTRRSVDVVVEDEGSAQRLLDALGFGASQAAMEVTLRSLWEEHQAFRFAGLLFTMAIFASFLFRDALSWLWGDLSPVTLVLVLWPVAMLVRYATRTHVRVGADGLLVKWLGRTRFVPYTDVVEVERHARSVLQEGSYTYSVRVSLASGEVIGLPVGPNEELANVLEQRIREAAEAHGGGGGDAPALLERRGREMPAWLRALRTIGSGANAQHREAPVPPERLWRVLNDPAAAPALRAGAAVALSSAGAEDRARLEEAARAVAAPKLRVAIEAAARGEDEALVEALDVLEADAAAEAAKRQPARARRRR